MRDTAVMLTGVGWLIAICALVPPDQGPTVSQLERVTTVTCPAGAAAGTIVVVRCLPTGRTIYARALSW